jgi:hypothetical protein
MLRFVIAASLFAGASLLSLTSASAQAVQYQFTPPPPVASLPGSSASGYAGGLESLPPPIAAPAPIRGTGPHTHSARAYRNRPRYVTTRRGRSIMVPPAFPGQHTAQNRVLRCMGAGAAGGLRPNQLGSFTNQCAN